MCADRGSLLNPYRDLLALRRRIPALQRGSDRRLDAPEGVLANERACPGSLARARGHAPLRLARVR